ncbi:MAG: toxin ParE1/3/4 [Candidatus Eremiobacteraeota bacterium]|nr:toxin ParE1/3/4 [Candidatus Eremiobacteraeota bacterium]
MAFTYRSRAARDFSAYPEERESLARADAVLARITARVRFLAQNPTIGKPRDDLLPGIRTWSESSFVIAYRATENDIEIIRVVHGARRVRELLAQSLADDA